MAVLEMTVESFVDDCVEAMNKGRVFFCCKGAIYLDKDGSYWVGSDKVTKAEARGALLSYYQGNHSAYREDCLYLRRRNLI